MQRCRYPNRTELTGYKLHGKRLAYTGKKLIRTIKFPLGELREIPNHEKSKKKRIILNSEAQEFAEKIKHDYEALYGRLNLITYIERPNVYSLKDFWVDSLRAGIIIMPTTKKLKNVISTYCGLEEELDERRKKKMKDTNPEFFENIDYEKFKQEVILIDEFRRKKSLDIFKTDCDEKYKEKTETKILKDTVGKGVKIKEEYFKKNYGVDETKDSNEKPSFYVFPDLPLIEDLLVDDCIERIEKRIVDKISKKSKKEEITDLMKDLLGTSKNASGFSNYFGNIFDKLNKGHVDSVIKTIINLQPSVWKDNENELKKRLNFLSTKAKLLEKPRIVKGWHYYRTDIGGKIESWLSNSLRQDDDIKKQLFGSKGEKWSKGNQVNYTEMGHYQELDEVEKELNTFKFTEEIGELKKEISKMKNVLTKIKEDSKIKNIPIQEEELKKENNRERISFDSLENYRNLLHGFRTKLNHVWQQEHGYIEDEEEGTKKQKEKPERLKKKFSKLHETLKSVPQFLGENKIKAGGIYDKYLQSLDRLNEGFDFLIEFQNGEHKFAKSELPKDKQIEKIKDTLQSLLNLYRVTNSVVARDIITKTLKRFYDDDIKKLRNKERKDDYFFRKKQSRDKRGDKLELSIKDDDTLLTCLSKLLDNLKVKWDKYRRIDYWNNGKTYSEWVGLIELEKVRLGLVAAFYDILPIKKNLKKRNKHFPNVDLVFSRYQEEKERSESKNISAVIQQAVLSELRGTVSTMSTKEFVMRYVVQPIDSEKNYPIAKNEKKYYIKLEKVNKKNGGDGRIKVLSGKVLNNSGLKEEPYKRSSLLKIHSSKYQLQFFDNAFSNGWKKFSPKISSYSLIYEETYKVNWTAEKPNFELDDESKRLYVSIPFNLEYKNKKYQEKLAKRDKFLGIDIGEYGIAMYILDANNFSPDCAYTRFVYEPTLRKIRESVKKLGDEKRAGTFSVPNTKLKRQRDYAITSLRNKIHDVSVRFDARPLYEKGVSNFESGSGKISKIYHSIKRSDVKAEIAADELEHSLVWGDKKLMIGNDVSEYATSYMCSHCYKSIYTRIKDYKQKYAIKAVDSHVVLIDVDGENVYGYFKERKSVGEEINGKDALNSIRDYARPPLISAVERSLKLGELFKVKKDKNGKPKNNYVMDNFQKERGSQAIYICPFKNCHQISDADKQAAMWIALKGYLNMFTIRKKEAKGIRKLETKVFKNKEITDKWNSDRKIEYLLSFAKDKKIPPVEFILDSRYFEKNKRKNAA